MESTWTQRLARGGIGGIAGGVASAAVLWVAVEPALDRAIALEGAGGAGHSHVEATSSHSHSHEAGETVTRLQQQIGGTVTVVVVAALMGLVFAVVYARSRHRLPGRTDLGRSLLLGGLAFGVLALGPALLIPANPPGVGDPETVDHRTLGYLLVVGLGALLVGAAFGLRHLLARRGAAPEVAWALVAVGVTIGVAAIALLAPVPAVVVPSSMPAGLLWDFRMGSLAQLGAMWGVIGFVHGALVHRAATRRRESAPPALVHA